MEAFEDYKSKIEQLLNDIDLLDFSIEAIQHGYTYQNCVYALTSLKQPEEKYVLRVPQLPQFRDNDGTCEAIEDDAALLGYLGDKLPVPRIKAYDATKDNALDKPYTVQTRLPGISLNEVYDDLSFAEKISIADQFVALLVKIESVRFATAGTFKPSSPLPSSSSDTTTTSAPSIQIFQEGDEDFIQAFLSESSQDRAGPDLKALLTSHIIGWLAQEAKAAAAAESFTISSLHFLLEMIDDLDQEGAFNATLSPSPSPIVLHHCDLEPRNLMVQKVHNTWEFCGIIDWDGAVALPRPLVRRAPDWMWDFDREGFTGYLDNDHHPTSNSSLSHENRALKAYFDAKAEEMLEGYKQDAYAQGRWLRRIWTFARGGLGSMWYIDLVRELERDWKGRVEVEVENGWLSSRSVL